MNKRKKIKLLALISILITMISAGSNEKKETKNIPIFSFSSEEIFDSNETYTSTIGNYKDFVDPIKPKISEKSIFQDKPTLVKKILISAIGDCTLGKDVTFKYQNSFNEYFDKYGSDYFFAKVKDLFLKDDLTIANLECALTESKNYADKEWRYSGKPEYAKILKDSSIEVVSLANNHTLDYFKKGLDDTFKTLNEYDIKYTYKDIIYYTEIKGIKIAFVSIAWDKYEDIKLYLEEAVKNSDLQIVSMHSGINYEKNYNNEQEKLGHYLVDNGADLVLGSHPHILQGIEIYKDVCIAYSLGNFCYGGKRNLGDENNTMILQITFKYNNNNFIGQDIKIIPAHMSSTLPQNNYQPEIIENIIEKNNIIEKVLSLSKNFNYNDK